MIFNTYLLHSHIHIHVHAYTDIITSNYTNTILHCMYMYTFVLLHVQVGLFLSDLVEQVDLGDHIRSISRVSYQYDHQLDKGVHRVVTLGSSHSCID